MTWTDDVARFVLDTAACPRCHTRTWGGGAAMRAGVCARCGADLRGEAGAELWESSEAFVDAARRRQALVDALPTAAREATGSPQAADGIPHHASAQPAEETATPESGVDERPRSALSLQSVLAVVGAGLLAVAAIVFTFLNPDLTDFATRTTIIAFVTTLFLGGAWLLRRRGLQFSAEAIGALGMVFLALDVWAFSHAAPIGVSAWLFGALGLVVSGGAMVAVGVRLRMRTWLWTGFASLAITPAVVGYGVAESVREPGMWPEAWGHIGVVFTGWLLLELARVIARRIASPLRADRVTLTALQLLAVFLAVVQLLFAPAGMPDVPRQLAIASALGLLAVAGLLTTRVVAATLWSVLGGLLVSGAFIAAVFAVPIDPPVWTLALLAVAVMVPVLAIAFVRRMGSIRRTALTLSSLVVAAFIAIAAMMMLGGFGLEALARAWRAAAPAVLDAEAARAVLVGVLALTVIAFGVWVLSRTETQEESTVPLSLVARWLTVPVAAGLPLAFPWRMEAVVTASLAIAVLASLSLLWLPGLRSASRPLRAPVLTIAYGSIVEAVAFSWPDAALAATAGGASVAALTLAARTAPAALRPLHTAVGFGYALITGAAALSLTALDLLPILCLLTSAAALTALAASLTSWLPVGSWYALLGVTGVPFGIGIVSVLLERSGWTALSSGVIFLLAVTLLLTRRTGAGHVIRAGAAALLVPTLAVVVVCLAAELLTVSGSPYALVVIAVLVACALPTTGLVRSALVRRGMPAETADDVRLTIESSSLVTGAIAVVLALVRAAAGLDIAFIVLLVLGLGAAATALWMRRRSAWWTASAAWTGALWCAWAIAGVTVVEPYLLPPAAAAMIVGTVLVARRTGQARRSAAALFATGLGVAIVPSLALLALTGNGVGTSPGGIPELWRTYALLAAGVLLTVLAGLVTRAPDARSLRFDVIRTPLLLGALVAAGAGAVQGIRLGWDLDPLPLSEVHPMVQALGFAVVAAAIAVAAARLAFIGGSRSRWLLVPAFLSLALGPMASVENDPLSIWTLWALELLLLTVMMATVWRARERELPLPPVWFHWSLAWVVAVVAWSQREILRVEGFALPLGLALVVVGAIAFGRGVRPDDSPRFSSWPLAFRGSWATLAPGIIATLLPSVLATFTDPQTWRAILVIAFALIAVLVGARKTLAAPFILGISTLPLEILIVFLVQLGDRINPLLWWITLATAGIVLLVIAVGWERRTGVDASLGARIRDLR